MPLHGTNILIFTQLHKMNKTNYIHAKTFEDFCKNQNTLIEILNHRMTKMESNVNAMKVDVGWIKKATWTMVGVALTIFGAIVIQSILNK